MAERRVRPRSMPLWRRGFRRLHGLAIRVTSRALTADELSAPAIVFAPHPDDETLGCGGTILRKRAAGADVRLVFLTDGAAANEWMSREALASMRDREAHEAADVLGVPHSHVTMLAFRDGELWSAFEPAVERVQAILEQHRPAQVFIPFNRGEHVDHKATCAIVYEAARRARIRATAFEYPIWLWRHWPTVRLGRGWREMRPVLAGSYRAFFGLRLIVQFRSRVRIRDVAETKRAALGRHASQMFAPAHYPGWGTLGDVSKGDFIACFFGDYEVFKRRRIG